jgi:3-hydroxyethyl bacteriochlorophyllide a dehydrogenase
MDTLAIVLEGPGQLALRELRTAPMAPTDVAVAVDWSGVSTGTERLLWTGRMPHFPGMGYPLVPGYESVGRVVDAGSEAQAMLGATVFVPGASCYLDARGLFGGAARRVIVPAARVVPVGETLGADAVLIALAATALHALGDGPPPELVVGHGVLGRLVARLAIARGGAPAVWEIDPARHAGGAGYVVTHPEADDRRDYARICDVSGSAAILDGLIGRLSRGGEIVLAGFYDQPLAFAFAPAFRAEARIRISAEFTPEDLRAVAALIEARTLSLDGLVTHIAPAGDARCAYPRAFEDRDCLKMVLDWREAA